MVSFPTDEEIRIQRVAKKRADEDLAEVKKRSPDISPQETHDTWLSLYSFHLKKLKGKSASNGNQ